MFSGFPVKVCTAPGLEYLLKSELELLLKKEISLKPERCGIVFPKLHDKEIWKLCSNSRLMSNIHLQLNEPFFSPEKLSFQKILHSISWSKFLPFQEKNQKIRIKSTFSASNLDSQIVEENILHYLQQNNLIPKEKTEKEIEEEKKYLFLLKKGYYEKSNKPIVPTEFIIHSETISDNSTIGLECFGDICYRGYLKSICELPIREYITASCLDKINYSGEPIWDPFCGTGSFIFEAFFRYLAMNYPDVNINQLTNPRKKFQFEYWHNFNDSIRDEFYQFSSDKIQKSNVMLKDSVFPTIPVIMLGSDNIYVATTFAYNNWNSLFPFYEQTKQSKIDFIVGDFEHIGIYFIPEYFPSPPIIFTELPNDRNDNTFNLYERFQDFLINYPSRYSECYVIQKFYGDIQRPYLDEENWEIILPILDGLVKLIINFFFSF